MEWADKQSLMDVAKAQVTAVTATEQSSHHHHDHHGVARSKFSAVDSI